MKRNALLLLLACLVFQQPSFSQGLAFNHLSVDDGLSNNPVLSICQDSRGFMWFGTYHGLNKYDGYRLTSYLSNARDPAALSDNIVTCVHEDRAQNLWVGTRLSGLNRYDRARDAFVHYTKDSKPPYQLSSNRITCLLEDN